MTSPKVDQSIEYARMNWPILSAIGVGLLMWGMTLQRVNAIEEEIDDADDQRERVVRIETQITTITTQLEEGKVERKELSEGVTALEMEVQKGFNSLLIELQKQRNDS